jgi:hypothetical protein
MPLASGKDSAYRVRNRYKQVLHNTQSSQHHQLGPPLPCSLLADPRSPASGAGPARNGLACVATLTPEHGAELIVVATATDADGLDRASNLLDFGLREVDLARLRVLDGTRRLPLYSPGSARPCSSQSTKRTKSRAVG